MTLFGASAGSAQIEPEVCTDPPAETVSSGRIALFDVYWDAETLTLNNNPCPPLVVHKPAGFDPTTELPIPAHTTRDPSDVDIGHTIIHIPSSELQKEAEGDIPAVRSFKRTVTDDDMEDYGGERYDFLRPKQADGTRAASADVWVVPACEEEEEVGTPRRTALDPPFCLGFSAGLLQLNDWDEAPDAAAGEGPTVQYEFEAIRQPGHATPNGGWGDFFVFHVENGEPEIKWRTDEADTNAYKITPGTYDHAFWAFTQPGTYVFHVQVKGRPNLTPSVGGPLIEAETVTSEVRRYTFHVGELTLDEQPRFQVERSVAENAGGGVAVGDPIAVTGAGTDILDYWLTGDGSDNFSVSAVANGAQIAVANGASLDFETTPTYHLTLHVSDDKSRTGALDLATDDTIAVHITLEDLTELTPSVALSAEPAAPTTGETVVLTATVSHSPVALEHLHYTWGEHDVAGTGRWRSIATRQATWQATHTRPGLRRYVVRVWYTDTAGTLTAWESDEIDVTWSSP